MQRLQVIFSKRGEARFLSHLDLLATLEYALRRAHLPLALAEGFNPRPRMSIALPLPLGYLGEREILEVTLRERREPSDVSHLLNASLPSGLRVLSVEETDTQRRHAASRLQAAVYRIELAEEVPGLAERVDVLLARDRLEVEEAREKGVRVRDLRPFILSLEAPDGRLLRLRTALVEGASVRPEQVAELLGIDPEGIVITREWIEVG